MTLADLPAWAALLTALFVLLGAVLALIGSLGLLRLKSFYARAHAPTLGTTLGTGSVLAASIICFSVLETRFVLHELLIAFFVTITTPVTLMLLVRAALYRDHLAGDETVPPLRTGELVPRDPSVSQKQPDGAKDRVTSSH